MSWGGFGQAPKFPSPYVFELLWRGWLRDRGNSKLADAVTITLDRMCQGGIYDHLGGGFARYATDNEWLIPHFEKMLYDNAQLVDLLCLVWQETKSPLYAARIAETCDWVLREMTAESGGFAASYDADSEGVEGKFYVWDAAEIDAVLGAEDSAFFRTAYDVTAEGNWEHHTILHRNRAPALAERRRGAAPRRLARQAQGGARQAGVAGLGRQGAGRLERPDDRRARQRLGACSSATTGWRPRRARGASSWTRCATTTAGCSIPIAPRKRLHRGTLDDYANMARAGVALFEVTGETPLPRRGAGADRRARQALRRSGGRRATSSTADDAADLIVRGKHCHDNAVPAGNGTLVGVFARLWVLTGEARWHDKARAQVAAFAGELDSNFFPLMTLLNGYETLQSAAEMVLVGDPTAPETEALRRAIYDKSLPDKVVRRLAPDTPLAREPSGRRQRSRRRQARALRLPQHGLRAADHRSGEGVRPTAARYCSRAAASRSTAPI